jgi:uncharacterized protein (DUF2141 family)
MRSSFFRLPLFVAALALASGGLVGSAGGHAQAGETLVFVVHDIRSDTGTLRGGIYADAGRWTQVGGQVAVCTARVSGGTARCVIHAPGPGTYAFAFYHDADDDNQLDRDLVGIPQEGYGFSNDVRPGLGPPSFESASFRVAANETYSARVVARYGWSP